MGEVVATQPIQVGMGILEATAIQAVHMSLMPGRRIPGLMDILPDGYIPEVDMRTTEAAGIMVVTVTTVARAITVDMGIIEAVHG